MHTLLNFNAFRDTAHEASRSAGWWKGSERYATRVHGDPDVDPDRLSVPTKLCLVHSEISEARYGYRHGNADDHLPTWPNAVIELADTVIRIGDLAGYLNIDMSSAIALVMQADHMEWRGVLLVHGAELFDGLDGWFNALHGFTSGAMEGYRKNTQDDIIPALSAFAANLARVVIVCAMIAERNDWDLFDAAAAKMRYNAVREDHKAEVRALEGGKAF